MLVSRSRFDYAETVRRLLSGIERRWLTLFGRIDHAAAAREAGLELASEEVFVFGNPKAGTVLMQTDPRIGIELPLRILAWEDADGALLGYHDPRELAERYSVEPHVATLQAMAGLLAELTSEATE
ncbi:MAG: DUF302 domain-containing protein [Solirubrobacteraceae bacterium]